MTMSFKSSNFNVNKVKNYNFVGPVSVINKPYDFTNNDYKEIMQYDYDNDGVIDYEQVSMNPFYKIEDYISNNATDEEILADIRAYKEKYLSKDPGFNVPDNIILDQVRKIIYNKNNPETAIGPTGEELKRQRIAAATENINSLLNNMDFTKDIWSEKLDYKWKIENVNCSREVVNDLNKQKNEYNYYQNRLNELIRIQNQFDLADRPIVNNGHNVSITSNGESIILSAENYYIYEDVINQFVNEETEKVSELKDSLMSNIRSLCKDYYAKLQKTSEDPNTPFGKYCNSHTLDEVNAYLSSGEMTSDQTKDWGKLDALLFANMSDKEKYLYAYLYIENPEEAKKYLFFIEESINDKIGYERSQDFIKKLKYSDLIWLKNEFPEILESEAFGQYVKTHNVKDIPIDVPYAKGIAVEKTYENPRSMYGSYNVTQYIPYTDEQKKMYWYLYEKYDAETANYYLLYLSGEGDLEDSLYNRFFTDFKSLGDGITTWLNDVGNIFDPQENHTIEDYEKFYILTYLGSVSPDLEKRYNILEKLGESIVPGVIAIASEAVLHGSGGYVFNILVGIGTMGNTMHLSAMEGYTGFNAFWHGLADGASKAIILTVLQQTLGSKFESKFISAVVDTMSDILAAGVSDFLAAKAEELMTGTNISIKGFADEEIPKLLEIGIVSALFNSTSLLTIEFSDNTHVDLTEEQVSDVIEQINSSKAKLDLNSILGIIAKVTGESADTLSEKIPVTIIKGIIKA